jgi:hypothetical protein
MYKCTNGTMAPVAVLQYGKFVNHSGWMPFRRVQFPVSTECVKVYLCSLKFSHIHHGLLPRSLHHDLCLSFTIVRSALTTREDIYMLARSRKASWRNTYRSRPTKRYLTSELGVSRNNGHCHAESCKPWRYHIHSTSRWPTNNQP